MAQSYGILKAQGAQSTMAGPGKKERSWFVTMMFRGTNETIGLPNPASGDISSVSRPSKDGRMESLSPIPSHRYQISAPDSIAPDAHHSFPDTDVTIDQGPRSSCCRLGFLVANRV